MQEQGPDLPEFKKGQWEDPEDFFAVDESLEHFTFGQIVKVRNAEGEIEDGWMIRRVNADGMVELIKENPQKAKLMKDPFYIDAERMHVPLSELQKLNPESERPEFNTNYIERSADYFDRISVEANERGDHQAAWINSQRAIMALRKLILIERRDQNK